MKSPRTAAAADSSLPHPAAVDVRRRPGDRRARRARGPLRRPAADGRLPERRRRRALRGGDAAGGRRPRAARAERRARRGRAARRRRRPYGIPVLVAERLCETAEPGEILASDVVARVAGPRTAEPIHPVGAVRLRGLSDRVTASRVAWREQAVAATPAPARTIGVVVADDQRLVRAGFRVILEDEPDIRVVGEASDGRVAVDVVRRTRPDVVLMDIRMPELNGLEAAERILSDPGLATAVLMLTTFDSDEYVYEALRIGASGFLLKDAPADRLLDAVRVAAGGDALLAPSITRRLIGQFTRAARPALDGVPAALAELTERELDVLRLVARGLSNGEIAAELVLGENTIKTHVASILRKLGLRDRVQAVVLAYECGLVMPEGEPGR